MGRIAFIADFFLEDSPLGGAEKCNDTLIQLLSLEVDKIKSEDVSIETLNHKIIIVSNHANLSQIVKEHLSRVCNYIIVEHDFGCLIFRDVSLYENYIAPKSHLVDLEFYSHAQAVFLQSDPHLEMWKKNTNLPNLYSLVANPYLQEEIDEILSYRQDEKLDKLAVLDHPAWFKNTKGAVELCKRALFEYEIIRQQGRDSYLKELAKYSGLVFFPMVFETFSRVCCEAALLGLKIYSNDNVSFTQSQYKSLKGKELSDFLLVNNKQIIDKMGRFF